MKSGVSVFSSMTAAPVSVSSFVILKKPSSKLKSEPVNCSSYPSAIVRNVPLFVEMKFFPARLFPVFPSGNIA